MFPCTTISIIKLADYSFLYSRERKVAFILARPRKLIHIKLLHSSGVSRSQGLHSSDAISAGLEGIGQFNPCICMINPI